MNYIKGESRSQIKIECLDEFVGEDSEVRIIDKVIDTLDIEALGFIMGKNEAVGRPMYNPRSLLKLYVYGYFNGIRSSRNLAKQTIINKEVIWLLEGVNPKYRVLADFRKDNTEALYKVFESFVDFCIELELYGKDLVAVDGTKIEASASKRKNYSKTKIAKMKKRIEDRINEYVHDLEKNDALDDEEINIDKDEIEKNIENLNEGFVEIVDKRTKENMEIYNLRQGLVEHPFGTIKRTMNFYYLLTRGFRKVRGEISLAFFSYNLKRVINILGTSKFLEILNERNISLYASKIIKKLAFLKNTKSRMKISKFRVFYFLIS